MESSGNFSIWDVVLSHAPSTLEQWIGTGLAVIGLVVLMKQGVITGAYRLWWKLRGMWRRQRRMRLNNELIADGIEEMLLAFEANNLISKQERIHWEHVLGSKIVGLKDLLPKRLQIKQNKKKKLHAYQVQKLKEKFEREKKQKEADEKRLREQRKLRGQSSDRFIPGDPPPVPPKMSKAERKAAAKGFQALVDQRAKLTA